MNKPSSLTFAIGLAALCCGLGHPAALSAEVSSDERPLVEVAIALDTSGTMNTLIDTIRLELWDVVGELLRLEPTPTVRVALLSYGSTRNAAGGFVNIEADLTEDLDLVAEHLFALRSGGDTEYVARAVVMALEGLGWTDSDEVLKLIFVAGNEPADQDPMFSLEEAALLARDAGVAVTTVFSGSGRSRDSASWQRLASLTQGQYAVIGPGGAATETPFDAELAQLGGALNETYIPLGEGGQRRVESIATQDQNALDLGGPVAASRAQVKATSSFTGSWDLLEAVDSRSVDLADLPEAELPEVMRQMSYEERVLLVESTRAEREQIQAFIAELADQRRLYLASQAPKPGARSLRAVVRETVSGKAREKGLNHPVD